MTTTFAFSTVYLTLALCFAHAAHADTFSISDADFVGGVYEFRYYATTNTALVNGTPISFSSLVMTNNGFTGPVSEGVAYWEATGHFGAVQLAGDVTMGWDLSGISSSIGSVELLTNAAIFQFDPWAQHAFEDRIFGEVATPATFGSAPYTQYFEYVGDGNGAIGAYSNWSLIQDVTPLLSSGWLSNPDLFELRLGYQQHALDGAHPNIPGKHLQIFRDITGVGDQSFLLRVTTAPVPVPAAVWLFGSGIASLLGFSRRKKTRKTTRSTDV